MARIFKKPGDPRWFLDYKPPGKPRERPCAETTSKKEALDLLAEKLAQFKREKLGLEIVPTSKVRTIGEAWEMYLQNWCTPAMKLVEQSRYDGNVWGSWFADMELTDVTGDVVEKWLREKLEQPKVEYVTTRSGKKRKARPQKEITVNGHRRILSLVFNNLIKRRLFRGLNPVNETKPFPVAKRVYEMLTEAELQKLVPHIDADWKDICRVGFFTGLRRGEIYALRKDKKVIDFERATITPMASNERKMPKGRKIKTVPLTPEAIAPLRRAWDKADYGGLLFPDQNGKMRSRHLRPADVIRSAMSRAGLVEEWEHFCRWGCKVSERHSDEQHRRCSNCNRILYARAIVRQVRFHDLRHSIINHLLDNHVPIQVVSEFARHHDLNFTNAHYAHRTVEHVREAIAPKSIGEQLAALEARATPEEAKVLAAAREKLAQTRHSSSPAPSLRVAGGREK